MNEIQALNWARVADAVARKSASRELREDLVQSALLAILESPSDDLLDKAWAVRAGIRNPLRRLSRDRATEDASTHPEGTDPWTGHDAPHESWLEMLDEEDQLSRRIREAYDDEDIADQAASASSGTGYWGIEEGARTDDEPQPDPRWVEPIYMQNEYRLDWGEVDLAFEDYDPGWVRLPSGIDAYWKDVVRWNDTEGKKLSDELRAFLGTIARDAMTHAWERGLSPVEAAVFANQVARMVTGEAPRGKKGLYYSAVRDGCGDFMALCETGREVTLRAESDWDHVDGHGIVPAGEEFPVPCPGLTSGYGIEDQDVWMWLFPDGPGNEKYELPRGSDDDILALIEFVKDRVQPEDVTWARSPFIGEEDPGYQGWQLWDTAEARQAHIKACLLGLNDWNTCALAGRKAFWARKDRNWLLRRNYQALHAEGLDRDDSYKVVWVNEEKPAQPYVEEGESYWNYILGA